MSRIGYARVSTRTQYLDLQIQKLKAAGCQTIYAEKVSGFATDRRELKACLTALQAQDCLVVTQLDRLSRSYAQLSSLLGTLQTKQIDLQLLDTQAQPQAIDQMMGYILAAFASYDGAMRKVRQTAGIQRAKANGVKLGRKPKLTPEVVSAIQRDRRKGISIKTLSGTYALSPASLYRALKKVRQASVAAVCLSHSFWQTPKTERKPPHPRIKPFVGRV
jgi:DNA invertase Pin-like site-specific DNA recombinase